MSDEEEYVVESIVAARVKRKGRSRAWEYRVRWKGYKEEDDTWEPIQSFADSEHFVENFWKRASKSLNGRDIKNLSTFKVGEEFFPVGPPLRKSKSQPALKSTSPVASGSKANQTPVNNNKRRRTPTPTPPNEPSAKRARQSVNPSLESPSGHRANRALTSNSPRRSARKPQREPSVVPASEGEEDGEVEFVENLITSEAPPRFRRHSADNTGLVEDIVGSLPEAEEISTIVDSPAPAPQARTDHSEVHMLDNLAGVDGTISVEAQTPSKVVVNPTPKSSTKPASGRRRKPGPGRSSEGFAKGKNTNSMSTTDKSKSKTVMRTSVSTEIAVQREEVTETQGDALMTDDSPLPPAELLTIEDLLQSAAFSEDIEQSQNNAKDIPTAGPSNTTGSIFSLAKESLFPSWSGISFPHPAFTKRPTIFGPLGSGSDSQAIKTINAENSTRVVQTQPFSVTLDVSKKLPVMLTDLSPEDAPVLDKIVHNASKGPPGKFYSDKSALTILDTLHTGGASAKVILSPNATESETQEFEKLNERLSRNELFVLMVDFDLLVFCSSSASLITQRLNIRPSLLSEPGQLLVERVTISNHSAYANAVLQTDD
ncbi:hypothetical protein EV361DRAFT_984646 [Lentinula raphanica]|nr:hypothetical protein C8R42DRAFT_718130 [Lentinula raphanica]KAJ3977075.1 hypothetical protein EV361DRAFT_984646 [Lentinula raphanica]